MSQILYPGQRPDEWQTLGDHQRRIERLEAVTIPDCCDSGFTSYYDCIVANQNVQYYWPCQEASGDLAEAIAAFAPGIPEFSDVSGTDYPLYQRPGPFGDFAVEFAGSAGTPPTGDDDYFEMSHGGLFDVFRDDRPFAIDMLVYPVANDAQPRRLFEYWGGTIGQWILIDRDASGRITFTRTNGGNAASAATLTPLGTWTAIRVGHDGTNTYIYINGVLASSSASSTTTLSVSPGGFTLGNNKNTGGTGFFPFNGRIAHVSIMNVWSTDFCENISPDGPVIGVQEGMVLSADGSGGADWAFPTVAVLDDDAEVPSRRPNVNFVTNASGLLAPDVDDNAALDASDVTFEIVPGADGQVLSTVGSSVEWQDPATPDPADDTKVWMPLTTTVGGDDVLVFDTDHSLIPTLIPF